MSAAPQTLDRTGNSAADNGERSRKRWIVLVLLFTITVINFIDRQTVSVLAPVLREVLHLSNEAYGRVVAAFQFGMMVNELPMGWFMDRWGARIGIAAAVLWWSGATGCQALTRSGTELGLTRFWMGTGECGNYSGGIKAVTHYFSEKERTLAIGIFNSGSMIGATIAPPIVVFLALHYSYRAAFLLSASLGLLWVPLWWFVYRDGRRATGATAGVPTGELLRNPSAWAVMSCRFFIGPVIQFYWYWIPNYLYSSRHMTLEQIGFISWIPFLMGDVGGVAGGTAAKWLHARGFSVRDVRRITMYTSAAFCLASFAVPYVGGILPAFVLIGVAALADNFLSANMFGAVTDLFPEQTAGRATGLTGVAGGLSGLLFPLLTGFLVDKVSYTPVFALVAIMPLAGTAALFTLGKQFRLPENTRRRERGDTNVSL